MTDRVERALVALAVFLVLLPVLLCVYVVVGDQFVKDLLSKLSVAAFAIVMMYVIDGLLKQKAKDSTE